MTYYTSNAGLEELRHEISAYMLRRFSLSYDAKTETVVTVGGSEAIDIAIRAVVEPGDEVIIPTPAFNLYETITTIAGFEGIFCGLSAIYSAMGQILTAEYGKDIIPLG